MNRTHPHKIFAARNEAVVSSVRCSNAHPSTAFAVCARWNTRPTLPSVATVFIVDDSPEVRHIVRTFLERDATFKVCGEPGRGDAAVAKALELKPDLILLDLLMPGMNGIETAAALRRALPTVQIVLFSNYTDDLGSKLASPANFDLVVPKGSLVDMAQSLKKLSSVRSIASDPSIPSPASKPLPPKKEMPQ